MTLLSIYLFIYISMSISIYFYFYFSEFIKLVVFSLSLSLSLSLSFNLICGCFRCKSVEVWVEQMVEELACGEVQEGVLEAAITLRLQANTSLAHLLAPRREQIIGRLTIIYIGRVFCLSLSLSLVLSLACLLIFFLWSISMIVL